MNVVSGVTLLIQIFVLYMLKQHICCVSDMHMFSLNNVKLEHVYDSTITSSKLACCVECKNDVNCLSVNYEISTRVCELSPLPRVAIGTHSVVDSNWIALSKENEWFLVFLGVAGNSVDVYEVWINGTSVTTDDVNCMKHDFKSCTSQHYRNKAVDSWATLSIKQVKYSLFKNSQEVAYVTFDGEGHSIDSWFTNGSIIASSWTDIQTKTFNHFSIEGFSPSRRFYISVIWDGCPADSAYTVTLTSQEYGCSYDYQDSYPQFLYSNISSFGYPETMQGFDKADAITIHVKM